MSDLGKRMARGAAWMVLFKLVERSLGLVTTLVLARLLVPEDFGIVAMATSVIAIVDILTGFSFDVAIVQKQDAERHHYDTAWTLNIVAYALVALLTAAVAAPAAVYYREPRVEPILYVLAAGVFVVGFENIGIVAFRKDLRFHKEFGFLLAKKLVAALVGISVAISFRSYWALVAGMVTSRVVGVALSYVVHPYRPRLALQGAGELLRFSKWLFLNQLVLALGGRAPDFVIGRLVGPASLGVYNVGLELATLPTTELVMPINRAVFPGYAKLAHDPDALRRGFLAVTSLVASLAVPAAVGVAAVADSLVMTLLGAKWRAAIPIIQILALYGLLRALQVLAMDLFVAAGRPAMQLRLSALNLAILVPSLVVGATSTGLAGAAWGALFTSLVMLPITYASLTVVLRQAHREYWRLFWRPALAAGVMFVAVGVWSEWFGSHSLARFDGLRLVTSVLIGAFAYGIALVGLWIAAGRPHGAESRVVGALRARVRVVVRA